MHQCWCCQSHYCRIGLSANYDHLLQYNMACFINIRYCWTRYSLSQSRWQQVYSLVDHSYCTILVTWETWFTPLIFSIGSGCVHPHTTFHTNTVPACQSVHDLCTFKAFLSLLFKFVFCFFCLLQFYEYDVACYNQISRWFNLFFETLLLQLLFGPLDCVRDYPGVPVPER